MTATWADPIATWADPVATWADVDDEPPTGCGPGPIGIAIDLRITGTVRFLYATGSVSGVSGPTGSAEGIAGPIGIAAALVPQGG